MTQEEKQLLLKDLCARVPYRTFVCLNPGAYNKPETCILTGVHGEKVHLNVDSDPFRVDHIKPYLRPMSSMTEEELRDFAKTKFENDALWEIVEFPKIECYKGFINVKCKNKNNGNITWTFQVNTRTPLKTYWGIDWLNAHHFDYRGLIEKGLALEAPEGMYTIKATD